MGDGKLYFIKSKLRFNQEHSIHIQAQERVLRPSHRGKHMRVGALEAAGKTYAKTLKTGFDIYYYWDISKFRTQCVSNLCDKGTVFLSQIEYIQIHTALAGRQGRFLL